MASYIVLDKKNPADKNELPRIKITIEMGEDERGKRKRKNKTVSLKSLSDRTIKKAIRDFEIEAAQSKPVDTDDLTYEQAAGKWLENHAADLSYNTRRSYTMNIQPAIAFFGSIKLKKLKILHILEYKKHLQNINADSIDYKMRINGIMLKKLFQWQLMDQDLSAASFPKKKRKELCFYNEEEIKQLFEVLSSSLFKHRVFIKLAVYSGMRIGELAGLTMENLDFANNTITVKHSLTFDEEKKAFFLGPTKNKLVRVLTMPEPFMKELKQYVKKVKTDRLASGAQWKGTEGMDLVFCKADGSPQHTASFSKSFQDIIKRHHLKRITFHDLRHTHASLLLAKGVNVKVIQERLGHSSIKITLDTYSHLTKELEREAADLLVGIENGRETANLLRDFV